MRIAIFLLSIAAALAIVVARYCMRIATLRQLALVIVVTQARSRPARIPVMWNFQGLLPRAIVRDLRVLDIDPTAKDVTAIAAAFGLGVALLGVFAGPFPAAAAAASVPIVGAAALNILANRRIVALGALMPGFFDRVRQLLVVGNSLPTAFARAVHGGQPKLTAYFMPVLRRVANGAGFSESVRQSADDISLYEMHLFSAAVSANMRFGGSLTHSLNNLVFFLRKRASIERELRANTALIRSSAWVLGLLPILVAALIVSQNRDYARWFVSDPMGQSLLVYCVISQILGVIVMRSIVRTEF